jgi:hypothetical protein
MNTRQYRDGHCAFCKAWVHQQAPVDQPVICCDCISGGRLAAIIAAAIPARGGLTLTQFQALGGRAPTIYERLDDELTRIRTQAHDAMRERLKVRGQD